MPAVIALGSACVLALAAYAGNLVLALAVALLQAVLVAVWVEVTAPADRVGALVLAGLAALAADLAVLLSGTDPPTLRPLAAVLGFLLPAGLLRLLARRDTGQTVLAALTGTVTLGVLAAFPAAVLAAQPIHGGTALVSCVLAGAALPAAAATVPAQGIGRALCLAAAGCLATASGAAVSHLDGAFGLVRGAVLSGVSAAVAVCLVVGAGHIVREAGWATETLRPPVARRRGRRGRRPRPASRPAAALPGQVFLVVVPLAAACPTAYLLGRLVVS